MKTILITGAAGFIGSSLVREALQRGYRVVAVDKLTYAGNLTSLKEVADHPHFEFERADICDGEKIRSLLKQYEPGGILHLAAESHVDRSIDGPEAFIVTNIQGTFSMLEAVRSYLESCEISARSDFRFVHVSTDEVYGDLPDKEAFFTEETAYNPSSPYAATKASSDHLVRAWFRSFNTPVLITNCSNNYGARQFPEKLIPHIILSALAGKPLSVYGDGNQIRDWLYVDDHATALMTVLEKGSIGETYNIGGQNEKKNIEVVRSICSLLEELAPEQKKGELSRYEDLITFVKDRPGHDVRYAIDASKIKRELGWVPLETFETGLEKTVSWYLNHHQWWEDVLSGEYRLNRKGLGE